MLQIVRYLPDHAWHYVTLYYHTGSWDSLLVERRTRDRKVASSNPGRSDRGIFFSRVNFVCWLLFSVLSTLVLLQWLVKYPNHSGQSADGRLRWNTHTPLDPTKLEWADYATLQTWCWNLSGNELTRNLSGNIRPQSSQLAEPLWTDPCIKIGIRVLVLISTLKKKQKTWAWCEWLNILQKSLQARKKPPPTTSDHAHSNRQYVVWSVVLWVVHVAWLCLYNRQYTNL